MSGAPVRLAPAPLLALRYQVVDGRLILHDGSPLVYVVKAGYTTKSDADAVTTELVRLLNREDGRP